MNTKQIDDAYAVLGLREGASRETITQAWSEMLLLWDPSLHSKGSKSYDQCVRIRAATNAAYELLTGCNPASEPVSQPLAAPPASQVESPDEQFAAAKEMEKTNIAEAVEMYQRLAQLGHAKAQFRLGYLYFTRDANQAAYWWKRAADQGHVVAQFNLGLMYERGVGMPKDADQACYWFCEAAKRGDLQAKNKIRAISSTSGVHQKILEGQKRPSISVSEMEAFLPWTQGDAAPPAGWQPPQDCAEREDKVS